LEKKSITIVINGYKLEEWIDLPNTNMKYKSAGKRTPGCLLKRLLDCYIETRASHKA
jgi:hypothetical protein